MKKTCIILAGGFGTRLQTVVNDVPKSMAKVAEKPFITYLFDYLEQQGFSKVVLSLGYKAEVIIDWLSSQKRSFEISYVIETNPLGTGGAIRYAFEKIEEPEAFIINGDTFFDVDTDFLLQSHRLKTADITIALKEMSGFDRYGSVETGDDGRIIRFNEKEYCEKGLINGGVYVVNKGIFSMLNLPERFSFEKDIMESCLNKLNIYGCRQDSYFIDIGIPADYEKANIDFKIKR